MRHSIFRTTGAGAISSAVLLGPAIAFACAPTSSSAGAYLGPVLAFLLAVAAVTYLATGLVTAIVSWNVERYLDVKLNKPMWWKNRIWAVGVTGAVAAFGVGALISYLGYLVGSTTMALGMFSGVGFVFLVTLPLVFQVSYVAHTWQKRGYTDVD